jgi:hypothetical protein
MSRFVTELFSIRRACWTRVVAVRRARRASIAVARA